MKCLKILLFLLIQIKILITPMKCENITFSIMAEEQFSHILNLINTIRNQRVVETILQISDDDAHLEVPDNLPTLFFNKCGLKNINFAYRINFNHDIIVLMTIQQTNVTDILKVTKEMLTKVANILFEMRSAPIILYFSQHQESAMMFEIMQEIYKHCFELKMLYLVTIFKNFHKTEFAYAYDAFTVNQIRIINYKKEKRIFQDYLGNLYGHKIRTMADQIEPRSMLYTDESGQQKLTGYLYKLIESFSAKHNGTLLFPYRMYEQKLLYYGDLSKQTKLGLLDVPISMLPSTLVYNPTSYTFEQMSYCLMLPMPPHMPVKVIFALLISPDVQTATILIALIYSGLLVLIKNRPAFKVKWWQLCPQMEVLRSVMDQPMLMTEKIGWNGRFICLQLFIFMFLENAMYTAYLNSLLTSPPVEPRVKNLEDFRARGLDIMVSENEYNLFVKNNKHSEPFWHHSLINETVKPMSFNDLQHLRNGMETGHAYPVTDVRWIYFNERQQFFERPLFYYEDRFCYAKLMYLTIPLQYNSIYKEAFNRVILQIQESGLRVYWLKQSFMDMIKLKRITREDLSPAVTFGGPLKLDDFDWVYMLIYSGTILSLFTFICECYWQTIKSNFDKYKKWQQKNCLFKRWKLN